ncbi:G-protein coupled receptor Mth2 [Cyphomyrmex costatus]|uniref:G-protein coupled receptor Mth2 n=1 Tax=Cyphomyrmex costatus TaxID=456900 RepID=A0A195CCR9_9HYME|nr:G-protein coupled receptor Mth2 [Cyphomyrmex costatus]
MYPSNIVFCFVFLLVASFSKSQGDFTNGNEQSDNSTVQSDPLVNSTEYRNEEIELTQCNSHENSIKNGEVQYESCTNSTKNNCKNQTSMESCMNSTDINNSTLQNINENLTKTEDKNISISVELYQNQDKITVDTDTYKVCSDNNVTCIQLCCPLTNNLTVKGRCIYHGEENFALPNIYTFKNDSKDETLNTLFVTVRDPCVETGYGRRMLSANTYLFLTNGSLYLSNGEFISPKSYCFAILLRKIYDVIVCTNETKLPIYVSVCQLVSLPFLLLTFIIYSILPDLQNMHGYTLRAHVGSLFITYAIMYVGQQISGLAEKSYCVELVKHLIHKNNEFFNTFAILYRHTYTIKKISQTEIYNNLLNLFSIYLQLLLFVEFFLAKCNMLRHLVDIELRSHRSRAKRDKKKRIIYSTYAWGITIILNVICAIMDYVPGLPENLIRPEICVKRFWYGENEAKTLYFYLPMGATIISNIFFFICTTLTILYQKIHTANQLKDSESNRHDENKQRFNMYLKLFIVMGISWVLEIIAWLTGSEIVPIWLWYPADMINSLQGLIIFIIFVCRKKVKQMLLKRFGGQSCGPFKIPLSDSVTSNTTSTTTTGSGTIPMQQIGPSN